MCSSDLLRHLLIGPHGTLVTVSLPLNLGRTRDQLTIEGLPPGLDPASLAWEGPEFMAMRLEPAVEDARSLVAALQDTEIEIERPRGTGTATASEEGQPDLPLFRIGDRLYLKPPGIVKLRDRPAGLQGCRVQIDFGTEHPWQIGRAHV